MLIFEKPQRKKHGFVSRVKTDNNRSLRLSIPYARYVNHMNQVLRIWIPEDSTIAEIFKEYDALCVNATITNNEAWFTNALTIDQIHEFFRPSVNRNVIALLSSETRPPLYIYKNEHIDSLDGLNLSQMRLSVDIEVQGLFFYEQKFGLRWLVTTIKIYDTDEDDMDEAEVAAQRKDIEETWTQDVHDLRISVARDIQEYREKIAILEQLNATAPRLLDDAKHKDNSLQEWDTCLTRLTVEMAKYYNGTIFICNKI